MRIFPCPSLSLPALAVGAALASGCGAGTRVDNSGDSGDTGAFDTGDGVDTTPPCTYPDGAVEPMALDQVITPYSWPTAVDRRTGTVISLDLGDVPCDTSEEIDWSPHDVLLFVSIPAW